MDQLAAMRSFVKVVDGGGFSEAARQLKLAVSSVTRQVNALEALLNTQLLNRSTRSITLTPQGYKYYAKVVQILQDIEEANLCVMEQGDVPQGILRVSLPVAFGRLHVAPILSDFLVQYPDVKLELRLSDGLANLVEEDLDLVIRMGNLDRSGANLILRKLASYTRLVCGSPAYFEKYGKPKHPNELAQHNCLLFAYSTGYDTWRFQREAEVCDVHIQGSLVANNSEMLRQVCLDGGGLILMPTWLIGEDIRAGRLQAVLTDFRIHPQADTNREIYALYLPNRRHSLRVKAFINFLAERFGNPAYWEQFE
ncbi:LysR family transcriptional regulator [Romeria aff. gracilis LEGE 07310]|uniref:LysR family transcriptional regulator n=1 Tax=Vasconcelosia minhoensis LEGE 07310 TaxID=915328 RepID=A0A8J7DMC9_9CYAN|nr:LysR family transcriptional regulator [Romeria gracilis]MBE9076370.1 LysR family transcriptional regulator [Romeria aff. gracilis LEGE 07310]